MKTSATVEQTAPAADGWLLPRWADLRSKNRLPVCKTWPDYPRTFATHEV